MYSNENLLINAIFDNMDSVVNQRVLSKYTCKEYKNKPTIDGWLDCTNRDDIAGYCQLTTASWELYGNFRTTQFAQFFEPKVRTQMRDRVITVSILCYGDSKEKKLAVYDGTFLYEFLFTPSSKLDLYKFTFKVPKSYKGSYNLSLRIYPSYHIEESVVSTTDKGQLWVRGVKVEFGYQQTLVHMESHGWVMNEPQNYGEELLKCMRRQVNLKNELNNSGGMIGIGYTNSTDTAEIFIPTNVPLLSKPAISYSTNSGYIFLRTFSDSSNITSISGISCSKFTKNGVYVIVKFSVASTIKAGTMIGLYINDISGAHFLLDSNVAY